MKLRELMETALAKGHLDDEVSLMVGDLRYDQIVVDVRAENPQQNGTGHRVRLIASAPQ